LGIDVVKPRLSWVLHSAVPEERDQYQTAYQVLVAGSLEKLSRERGDLWDSGRIASDQTVHVVYAGQALISRQHCYWKVRIWDHDGKGSPWSEPAQWSMGLLERSGWGAHWIGDPKAILDAEREAEVHRKVYSGYMAKTGSTDETSWVVLDLGKRLDIDGLRLHPAQPHDWPPDTPTHFFPLRFKLEAANEPDFSDARIVVDRTGEDQPAPAITEAPLYRFWPAEARYVRLTVTRLRAENEFISRLALAEMEVLCGEKNVARGAVVTAPHAVVAPGWSKEYLVDGRTQTERGDPIGLPATFLRKSFNLDGTIQRAQVHVTARGLYELRLNGSRVGDQLLAPEWTSYHKRIQYQTYDVTDHLRAGENVVAALLGSGWYIGRIGLFLNRHMYGTRPQLLLRMDVELDDGSTRTIVSDDTWKYTSDGPIRFSDILDGDFQHGYGRLFHQMASGRA
jgi:alpha-L-rhamnosidase